MAFLIFQGILCGEPKTSRAKNLIVVKQTEIDTLVNVPRKMTPRSRE